MTNGLGTLGYKETNCSFTPPLLNEGETGKLPINIIYRSNGRVIGTSKILVSNIDKIKSKYNEEIFHKSISHCFSPVLNMHLADFIVKRLEEQNFGESVVQCAFTVLNSDKAKKAKKLAKLIIDSGATSHYIKDEHFLSNTNPVKVPLKVANGHTITATRKGELTFNLEEKQNVTLTNVLYEG